MDYLYYQKLTNFNLDFMNLFTNLQYLIFSLYKYILDIYTYNIIYTLIESHIHQLIHEHIIMFEFGLFIFKSKLFP